MSEQPSWLLLLYGLPAKSGAARIALWRQLRRLGAVSLKTSASVLPDEPGHFESFQWLAQRVREQGGEATLVRAAKVEGVGEGELTGLFQQARAADYEELLKELRALAPARGGRLAKEALEDLEKIAAKFHAVRRIDFFDCPRAVDVEALIERLRQGGTSGAAPGRTLQVKHYQGRLWLTRPRPEVDRVGSAWLIRRFIDAKAEFVFAATPDAHPGALPYDMPGVEFGHHADDCTFETLLKRFKLEEPALRRVANIIHDADLEDGRHGTQEGAGLLAVFRGLASLGRADEDILKLGFDIFDALYCQMAARARRSLTGKKT